MRKIDLLLAEYGDSHRHPINKAIHWLCVPLIFWTILGSFALIPLPHIEVAWLGVFSYLDLAVLLFVTGFYVRLSPLIALCMFLLMLLMEYTVHLVQAQWGMMAGWIYGLVFVAAWIFQFIGHHLEGKKPSFFRDVQFLLIGPSWLLHFVLRKVGVPY